MFGAEVLEFMRSNSKSRSSMTNFIRRAETDSFNIMPKVVNLALFE